DQRVIAGGGEGARDAAKDGLLLVKHGRDLTVHDLLRLSHSTAVGFTETLVTQTDAERWKRWPQLQQEILADAGLGRGSRPGREDRSQRAQHGDVFQRDLIVAVDDDPLAQLTQVLDEVVGARGVVVAQEPDLA